METRNYIDKDTFSEHSKFMMMFLEKMDREAKLAEERLKEERKEAEARLSEERKEAENRLLAEERRLSEERKIAEERLMAEKRTSQAMFVTLIFTVLIGFASIITAFILH